MVDRTIAINQTIEPQICKIKLSCRCITLDIDAIKNTIVILLKKFIKTSNVNPFGSPDLTNRIVSDAILLNLGDAFTFRKRKANHAIPTATTVNIQ